MEELGLERAAHAERPPASRVSRAEEFDGLLQSCREGGTRRNRPFEHEAATRRERQSRVQGQGTVGVGDPGRETSAPARGSLRIGKHRAVAADGTERRRGGDADEDETPSPPGANTPWAPNSSIVVFDDPCKDIADLTGCTGYLGFGGPLIVIRSNCVPSSSVMVSTLK